METAPPDRTQRSLEALPSAQSREFKELEEFFLLSKLESGNGVTADRRRGISVQGWM